MNRLQGILIIPIYMLLWSLQGGNFSEKQRLGFMHPSKAFRCEYIMETTPPPYPYDTTLAISLQMRVQWTVTTNGRLYMIMGKLEYVTMADQVVLETQNVDTLLIDSQLNICFSFKDKIAAELDTLHIEDSIAKTDSYGRYIQVDASDSVFVYMDTAYQKFITPFPQVKGNHHGITKLKSPFQVCSLKSVTWQDFDFEPFLSRSSSFRKSSEKIPLPFL